MLLALSDSSINGRIVCLFVAYKTSFFPGRLRHLHQKTHTYIYVLSRPYNYVMNTNNYDEEWKLRYVLSSNYLLCAYISTYINIVICVISQNRNIGRTVFRQVCSNSLGCVYQFSCICFMFNRIFLIFYLEKKLWNV